MSHAAQPDLTQSNPVISVVMPVRNGEPYIREAIQSVLNQTYPYWELHIEDDGSTDRTEDLIREIAAKDQRIHYYRSERDTGTAATRNRCFRHCKGSYIAMLDCDDVWKPEKLEKQLALIQKENADLVYCSYAIIDEAGKKHAHDFIVPETITYRMSLVKSVMSSSTVLMRAEVINKVRFPIGYYHEDLCYWIQLMKNGYKAAGDQSVLAAYRVRSDSKTSNKLMTEWRRWLVYRRFCHFSVIKSTALSCAHAVICLYKYRPIKRRA